MYVPGPNAVHDAAVMCSLLRDAGVGHLVSAGADGTLGATVLPFLVDDELTTLRAHVARANPHWRGLDGATALLIVPVTDSYVSPGWYPSKADDPRVVPTWNYEVAHVHGEITVHDDADFVRRVVDDLTALNEARRLVTQPAPGEWSIDDAPVDFVERQLRALVGIELNVDRVVAKRKLSQNRSEADRAGVIEGLRGTGERRSGSVADAMNR